MSGEPRGQLWVDPEGVVHLGDAYSQHGALYEGYVTQLEQLRTRYGKSWGDDDMGQQFSLKFLEGLDALDGIIGGVKGTLDYTAMGLRKSGKLYEETNEQANEMSQMLGNSFEQLPQRPLRQHAVTNQAEPGEVTAFATGELRPMKRAVMRRGRTLDEQEPAYARERAEERIDGTPHGALSRLEAKQVYRSATKAERLAPPDGPLHELEPTVLHARARLALPKERYLGEDPEEGPMSPLLPEVAPGESQPRARMAMATSAHISVGSGHFIKIDGIPLAEGYELRGLTRFPDGTSRVDANMFQSISPLGQGHTVTDANGQLLNLPDSPLFVVKDNPGVDPNTPGYEPLLVSFAPDGTAVPIVTDL